MGCVPRRSRTFPAAACALVWLCLVLATTALAYPPDQAAEGAVLYTQRCSTCHGDVGQGLTDEFRATWPPGDRNCWIPACHGGNPPRPLGFSIPRIVPALVGPSTLTRFATAQELHAFIKGSMPLQEPGVLSDDEYWALTAFLLRENGVPADRTVLDASSARTVPIPRSGQPVPRPKNEPQTPPQAMSARDRAPMLKPTITPGDQPVAIVGDVSAEENRALATARPVARTASPGTSAWPYALLLIVLGLVIYANRAIRRPRR